MNQPQTSKARRYSSSAPPVRENLSRKMRGIMLYILPFPLLIAAISALLDGEIYGTLLAGGAFAAYMVAATIARHGFRLERDYQRRKIARAPRTPFKTVAALFISLTTGVLAWLGTGGDYGLLSAVLIGATNFLGFALYYGLDPRRDKAAGISIGVTVDEVMEALDAAEIRIEAIDQARQAIKNKDYNARLNRITHKAREILETIEANPTRLSSARKFLKVYLDGASKVTESYARSQNAQQAMPAALETDFNRVLDSIEQTFNEQHTKLLENNTFDLDVQISVLEQQLKREKVF